MADDMVSDSMTSCRSGWRTGSVQDPDVPGIPLLVRHESFNSVSLCAFSRGCSGVHGPVSWSRSTRYDSDVADDEVVLAMWDNLRLTSD